MSNAGASPRTRIVYYSDGRISFGYPQGWHVTAKGGDSNSKITVVAAGQPTTSVTITFRKGSGVDTPQVAVRKARLGLRSKPGYRFIRLRRTYHVSGEVPAYRLEALVGIGVARTHLVEIFFRDDFDHVGVITLRSRQARWAANGPTLARIVALVTIPNGD